MSMYFEGYREARQEVSEMSEADLLEYIDGLYGRKNLPEDYTADDLRREALEQCKSDFTDYSSEEYERTQFYIGLAQAMSKKE